LNFPGIQAPISGGRRGPLVPILKILMAVESSRGKLLFSFRSLFPFPLFFEHRLPFLNVDSAPTPDFFRGGNSVGFKGALCPGE